MSCLSRRKDDEMNVYIIETRLTKGMSETHLRFQLTVEKVLNLIMPRNCSNEIRNFAVAESSHRFVTTTEYLNIPKDLVHGSEKFDNNF